MSDTYIPEGEEPPRLGAVPVRFFGTYAFSWIESKRAIEPFDEEHMEHAANSRQPEFQRGVTEAKHFQVCRVTLFVHEEIGLHCRSPLHCYVAFDHRAQCHSG